MVVTALSGRELAERLDQAAPDSVVEHQGDTLWVTPASVAEVAGFLKDDEDLRLEFLNSISAIDFIEYFEVVYHLTSLQKQHTAVIKTRLYGRDNLTIPSVYQVWRGADFQEREVWDLMGVKFEGHPNMKRIMLWEGFEGHPLRKDFL